MKKPVILLALFLFVNVSFSQNLQEMGETMKEYIVENHIEDIEEMVHQFASTPEFQQFLLEQHNVYVDVMDIKRKDVGVGKDIDVHVKHITEHQNFTMLIIPISFYNYAIYDTLLFSVLEVSEHYVQRKYYQRNLDDPSEKRRILAQENHDLLTLHMYGQAMTTTRREVSEIQVNLKERYISTDEIHYQVKDLSENEKEEFREKWGLMKKIFSHNVNMNVEMNVYIFGQDDMDVTYVIDNTEVVFKISPGNIFPRHHFQDESVD